MPDMNKKFIFSLPDPPAQIGLECGIPVRMAAYNLPVQQHITIHVHPVKTQNHVRGIRLLLQDSATIPGVGTLIQIRGLPDQPVMRQADFLPAGALRLLPSASQR
jgi:hypothetical protein